MLIKTLFFFRWKERRTLAYDAKYIVRQHATDVMNKIIIYLRANNGNSVVNVGEYFASSVNAFKSSLLCATGIR